MRKSQSELIKAEIARLHEKGSGDWQSLDRQVLKNYKPINLNLMQMMMELDTGRHRELYVEAGRGAGKSTGIGGRIRQCVTDMPRSKNILLTNTYQKALIETLPGMILSLEMQGIFKDLHYFIGRRPPRAWKWAEPYQPPEKYDRIISFWTGACYQMVSQDVKGSGRGINADSLLADEAALINKQKLDAETKPTLRGSHLRQLQKKRTFLSELYCSTTPIAPEGFWFVEMEDSALQYPKDIHFLSATCQVNAHNLPDNYLEKAQQSTIDWVFEAEYLNIRPDAIKDGFYSLLSVDHHAYTSYDYNHYQQHTTADCRGDQDLVAGLPLVLGVDWGARINCLAVCQHLGSKKEFRALNSMYVLGERKEVQSDLFQQFHDYYRHHTNKRIYLWYDNSGNVQTGITKRTRAEMARDQLTKLGWSVQLMTYGGSNPRHNDKHLLWERILKEEDYHLPKFRINHANAKELWISLKNAKAKMSSRGEVQKDKSSERSKVIKPQHATDLSDAVDTAIFGMFYKQMQFGGSSLPEASSLH